MRALVTMLILIVTMMAAPWPAVAQTTDELLRSLGREIEALKESQARIQRELGEIKTLLRGREAREPAAPAEPQNLVFDVKGEPIKGERTARLVLIDFTDYQ